MQAIKIRAESPKGQRKYIHTFKVPFKVMEPNWSHGKGVHRNLEMVNRLKRIQECTKEPLKEVGHVGLPVSTQTNSA